jgi:hypothetical protein
MTGGNETADLVLHSGSKYAVGVLAGAMATTEGLWR